MTHFWNLGPFFLTTITIRFSRLIPHPQYMVVYFLHFSLHHKVTLSLSPPSNWPPQEWVPFQSLLPDVANGRVGLMVLLVKSSHFKLVGIRSSQLSCGLGQVDLYFHMIFYFILWKHVFAIWRLSSKSYHIISSYTILYNKSWA